MYRYPTIHVIFDPNLPIDAYSNQDLQDILYDLSQIDYRDYVGELMAIIDDERKTLRAAGISPNNPRYRERLKQITYEFINDIY